MNINLNKATVEELQAIPFIGKYKAQQIIGYREKTKFKDIYELSNVKGIGGYTLKQILKSSDVNLLV
jgi:competence protein ComEA